MANLARCLSDSSVLDCATKDYEVRLQTLRAAIDEIGKSGTNALPAQVLSQPKHETLGDLLGAVLDRTAMQRPKHQQRLFKLLDLLLAEDVIDRMSSMHLTVATGEKALAKTLKQLQSGHRKVPRSKVERAALNQSVDDISGPDTNDMVLATHLAYCMRHLDELANAKPQVWESFLKLIPQKHTELRVGLLSKWSQFINRRASPAWTHDFYRMLTPVVALMRRRGIAPALLRHWRGYVFGPNPNEELVRDATDNLRGNPDLPTRTVRLVEEVVYNSEADLGVGLMTSLVEFASAADDLELAASVVKSLCEDADRYLDVYEIRVAFRFGVTAGEIREILVALHETKEDLGEHADKLSAVAKVSVLQSLVARLIVAGDAKKLRRMAAMTQL